MKPTYRQNQQVYYDVQRIRRGYSCVRLLLLLAAITLLLAVAAVIAMGGG